MAALVSVRLGNGTGKMVYNGDDIGVVEKWDWPSAESLIDEVPPETLDGIKDGPNLHPLQRAFADNFAAQCGFCTPGMLMAAKALLDRNPQPSRAEIIEAISGNICRCTGYEPIINAVLAAASSGRARA